jgi:glycosyltransferase involved in cell wall biosynthesis
MRRALFIAYHYPPSRTAGTFRTVRFENHLRRAGWGVSVVTVAVPGGAPVDGPEVYRARELDLLGAVLKPLNRLRGLRRRRAAGGGGAASSGDKARRPARPGAWQRAKDRVSLLLTFPDSSVGWVPGAIRAGRRAVRRDGASVLYTSGPPHSVHLAGWALKALTGRPWAADFRDPWARKPWLAAHEREGWRARALARLERRVVRAADRVILNTDRMRDDFARAYPELDGDRFLSIPNGYDPALFEGLARRREAGPMRIIHAGTLYRKRDPGVLLDAVRALLDAGDLAEDEIELRFLGSVSAEVPFEARIRDLGLEKVVAVLPSVPHRECLQALYDADVLLIVQPETETQVPGKLYEYLYVGHPILALTHDGATADLVRRAAAGEVADPDRPEQVADAVRALHAAHKAGRPAAPDPEAVAAFEPGALGDRLEAVLGALAAGGGLA